MPRALDVAWLRQVCTDKESQDWIEKIIGWRDYTLKHNHFIDNESSFILNLGRYSLRFHAPSSYSAIEVYHEIFRDHSHFLAPGFGGRNLKVVFDIGANQGFYTLRLKETSPDCRVIAVEPNPREYTVLCENLRRNNIDTVVHENLAVAASGGTLRMEVIPEIGAIGGERVRIPERPWIKNEFVRILEVPAISLDELFSKHDVRTVDVLKIDVEGLEYEILKVCTKLSHVARIVVEYHDVNLKDKLLNLLEDKYFSCVKVDPSGSNPYSGDLYFVNNTFVSG